MPGTPPSLLFEAALATATALAAYIAVHELSHAAAAVLLGYRVRLGVRSDGLIPSPSIHVSPAVRGRLDKIVILYSPYIVILALLVATSGLAAPWLEVFRTVSLVGFSNVFLEEHASRARVAAAVLTAFLAGYLLLWGNAA